jgi:hypothetical protein
MSHCFFTNRKLEFAIRGFVDYDLTMTMLAMTILAAYTIYTYREVYT